MVEDAWVVGELLTGIEGALVVGEFLTGIEDARVVGEFLTGRGNIGGYCRGCIGDLRINIPTH